jgi:hypothetical protein
MQANPICGDGADSDYLASDNALFVNVGDFRSVGTEANLTGYVFGPRSEAVCVFCYDSYWGSGKRPHPDSSRPQ